ncbi:MAG: endonuclease III [Firmicutes bacterium]|nr:endonuclease III [Bacillota bacterium]
MNLRDHAQEVIAILASVYPDAHCELQFETPFQLLVATILSAQSTDEQVNKLTKVLFAEHPTVEDMARLSVEELEEYIRGVGLFRNKAKHIAATCQILLQEYGGQVPRTRGDLMRLPGVGRKTANVVLANAFNIPAFAVDTHVLRVSRRLGLATGRTPDQVEAELTALLPEEHWIKAHHWLIWHGRRQCYARRPACDTCPLSTICPSVLTNGGKSDE